MKPSRLSMVIVLMLFAAGVGADDTKKVVGRVLDSRSRKDQPVGVPKVEVKAYNDQNMLLKTTATLDDGTYTLEGIEPGVYLKIEHSKVNYRRDPEVFEGPAPSGYVTVYIGKKNGDLAYYKEVGDAIVDRSIYAELVC